MPTPRLRLRCQRAVQCRRLCCSPYVPWRQTMWMSLRDAWRHWRRESRYFWESDPRRRSPSPQARPVCPMPPLRFFRWDNSVRDLYSLISNSRGCIFIWECTPGNELFRSFCPGRIKFIPHRCWKGKFLLNTYKTHHNITFIGIHQWFFACCSKEIRIKSVSHAILSVFFRQFCIFT